MDINTLVELIQAEAEWLETTQGDEVEAVSLENLEGILSRFFNQEIKISQP